MKKKSYFLFPHPNNLSSEEQRQSLELNTFLADSPAFSFPRDTELVDLDTEGRLFVISRPSELRASDYSSFQDSHRLYVLYPKRLLMIERDWLFKDPFIVVRKVGDSTRVHFAPFVRPVRFSDLLEVRTLFRHTGRNGDGNSGEGTDGVSNADSIGGVGNTVLSHPLFNLLDRLSVSSCFSKRENPPSILSELYLSCVRDAGSNVLPREPTVRVSTECLEALQGRSFFQLLGMVPPESVFRTYSIVASDGGVLSSQQQQQPSGQMDMILGRACETFHQQQQPSNRFAFVVESNEGPSVDSPKQAEEIRELRRHETFEMRDLCSRINVMVGIVKGIMNGEGEDCLGDESTSTSLIPSLQCILREKFSFLRNSLMGAKTFLKGMSDRMNDLSGMSRSDREDLNLGENLYRTVCDNIRFPLAKILLDGLLSVFRERNGSTSGYFLKGDVQIQKKKFLSLDGLSSYTDAKPDFFAGFCSSRDEGLDAFSALLCEEKEGTSVGVQYADAKSLFLGAFAITRRLCWCRSSEFAKNFRLPLFLCSGLQCRVFLYRLNVGADVLIDDVSYPTLFLDGILSQLVLSTSDAVATSSDLTKSSFFHLKKHLAEVSATLLVTLYDSLKCLCVYQSSLSRELPLACVAGLTRTRTSSQSVSGPLTLKTAKRIKIVSILSPINEPSLGNAEFVLSTGVPAENRDNLRIGRYSGPSCDLCQNATSYVLKSGEDVSMWIEIRKRLERRQQDLKWFSPSFVFIGQLLANQRLGAEVLLVMPLHSLIDVLLFRSEKILHCLHDVSRGLSALHRHAKFVHADVKPSNLLYSSADNCYMISDFGLCCPLGSDVGTCGTLTYAPIELVQGGKTTRSTDYYCLGRTILDLLTNRHIERQRDTPQLSISVEEVVQLAVDRAELLFSKMEERSDRPIMFAEALYALASSWDNLDRDDLFLDLLKSVFPSLKGYFDEDGDQPFDDDDDDLDEDRDRSFDEDGGEGGGGGDEGRESRQEERPQGEPSPSGSSSMHCVNLSMVPTSSAQSIKLATFLLLVSPLVEELDLCEIEMMISLFLRPVITLELQQQRASGLCSALVRPMALCFKVIRALCRCLSQTSTLLRFEFDDFEAPFLQTASQICFESVSEFSLFLLELGHLLRDVPSQIVYTLVDRWGDLYRLNECINPKEMFLKCLGLSLRIQDRVRFVVNKGGRRGRRKSDFVHQRHGGAISVFLDQESQGFEANKGNNSIILVQL